MKLEKDSFAVTSFFNEQPFIDETSHSAISYFSYQPPSSIPKQTFQGLDQKQLLRIDSTARDIYERYKDRRNTLGRNWYQSVDGSFHVDIFDRKTGEFIAQYLVDRFDIDMKKGRDRIDLMACSYMKKQVQSWNPEIFKNHQENIKGYDERIELLVSEYSFLNKTIGEYVFTSSAQYLYDFHNISCVDVLYTMRNGIPHQTKDPHLTIYVNQKSAIKVLVNKKQIVGVCALSIPLEEIVNERIQEKQQRARDEKDILSCIEKVNAYSDELFKVFLEKWARDELSPSSGNWFSSGPKELSSGCTFGGWNFLPRALLGITTFNLAPRVAALAIESVLCSQVGVLALPAIAISPAAVCIAVEVAGLCIIADAALKAVISIFKLVAHAKSLLGVYEKIKKIESTIPNIITESLQEDAEARTITECVDTKSEIISCASSGGPEPPEDPENNDDDDGGDPEDEESVNRRFEKEYDKPKTQSDRTFINNEKMNLSERSNNGLMKSFKSFKEQARAHIKKLRQYKKNPDSMNNQGWLKNAKSVAEREKIIMDRIESLRKQIKKHTNQSFAAQELLRERGIDLC